MTDNRTSIHPLAIFMIKRRSERPIIWEWHWKFGQVTDGELESGLAELMSENGTRTAGAHQLSASQINEEIS